MRFINFSAEKTHGIIVAYPDHKGLYKATSRTEVITALTNGKHDNPVYVRMNSNSRNWQELP
jgi:hypothetical protein